MSFRENFITDLYKINESNFNIKALSLFNYQYSHNSIYNSYANLIRKTPETVKNITDIPFLPVSFYKTEKILTGNTIPSHCFYSSGTTDKSNRSKHYIADLQLYTDVFTCIFTTKYGYPSEYIILALLPSYQENKDSSLLYMVDHLISKTGSEHSSFLSNDYKEFLGKIPFYKATGKKIILLGVAYALLELAEFNPDLAGFTIMETGGMKGKRKELVKSEMHEYLKTSFHVTTIHSEYGMTELLSQAYSKENGIFECPSWMKVLSRQLNDPFDIRTEGRGALNIIDLANIDSCAFIEIEDMGNIHSNGKFELLGRMDNSEIRGCNLLYA